MKQDANIRDDHNETGDWLIREQNEHNLRTNDCDHQYQETMITPLGVVCIKCGHFVGAWE